MKRTLGTSLALAAALCLAGQKDSERSSLFEEIDAISRGLESIAGLKFKHSVPSSVIDKTRLRKFLNQRIDQTLKPEDLKAESLTLKMLGLVPQSFDLRQETVDLLTEQAAAFYDYRKKKLFVLDGDTGEAARMALAHELAHALADQNFRLERYIKQGSQSDDAANARMAVMEGQATWLMAAYLHQRAGLGADVPLPMLTMMTHTVEEGASQYPVFSQSPLYIRESLTFPYKAGMLFQDAVYRKLGRDGFAEVFRHAPLSTQQVIHPERYLDHQEPKLPALPAVAEPRQLRKLAEGTLGEFDIRILLTQYSNKEQTEALSPAFSGSRFALFETKREQVPLLAWSSQWQSPERAREFFVFYRSVLRAKSKTFEPGLETDSTLQGRTELGFYRVSLIGQTVASIEGLKSSVN